MAMNQSLNLSVTPFNTINITAIPLTTIQMNTMQLDNNITAPFKTVMLVLYGILFLIGIPGNLLVILTIFRVPRMRSVKNLFILNLAFGDFINILWCCPTAAISLYISWPYGETICQYVFPITDVIIGNTVFTMVAITLDRYRAIVKPFAAKLSLKNTVIVLIANWVVGYALIGLPLSFINNVSRGYWVEYTCNSEWPSLFYKQIYRFEQIVLQFTIPCIIFMFSFYHIRKQLKANIKFSSKTIRGRARVKRAFKHQRLIKMLFVMIISFMFCFFPVVLLCLLDLVNYQMTLKYEYLGIIFQLALVLLFSSSIMNPIILFILSREYRLGYLRQLKCLCPNSKIINTTINNIIKVSNSFKLKSSRKSNKKGVKVTASQRLVIETDHESSSSLGVTVVSTQSSLERKKISIIAEKEVLV